MYVHVVFTVGIPFSLLSFISCPLSLLKTPIHGHGEGELWGLAVHPAALSFVTASEDKTVRLWNLSTKVCSQVHDVVYSLKVSQVIAGMCLSSIVELQTLD